MALITEFDASQAYTFHDGRLFVNVLAKAIDTNGLATVAGELAFFSALVDAPDEGMEWVLGTIKSPMREQTNLFNEGGAWSTTTTQNEEIADRTGDLTFRADASYETGTNVNNSAQCKDALVAMLSGMVFNDGSGGLWKVVGTNGVEKQPTYTYSSDIASMFLLDTKLTKTQASSATGEKERYRNPMLEAHSKNTMTVMMEKYITTKLGENTVYRYPAVIVSNPRITENGEANTYACGYNFVTEAQMYNSLFIEGVDGTLLDSAGTVEQINVGGTSSNTLADETGTGTEDVIIDKSTGIVSSGNSLTFKEGTIVYDEDTLTYISIYDESGVLKALNVTGATTGLTDYQMKMYQFDSNSEKFVIIT